MPNLTERCEHGWIDAADQCPDCKKLNALRARVAELEAENAILRAHRCEVGMEDPGAMLEHLESLSTEELEEINQSINRR